jgi:ABC-type nitrate/sulfonate/bicarbonate transport system substrate-binding protein
MPPHELRGKSMIARRYGLGLLMFLLIFASPKVWSQDSAGLKRIRIGMPNRGAIVLGLLAAQTYGQFRAQGLHAELIVMRPSTSLQTLMSGDLDFSTALASGARASVSGLPMRIVMALNVGQDFTLVVRPEIRRVEDLRGKTLATSGVGEFTDVGARMILKKYGLLPEVDVKLRTLFGNHPLRLSALQAGQIDGTIMTMPYNKMAVKMGFRELVHLREIFKAPQGGLVTTLQRIRTDADMISRAVKSALLGNRFLKEHKAEFMKLLAKESGVQDPVVAGLIHEEIVKLYSDTGLISDDATQELIASAKEVLKTSREVSLAEVVDFSFARKAATEIREGR